MCVCVFVIEKGMLVRVFEIEGVWVYVFTIYERMKAVSFVGI